MYKAYIKSTMDFCFCLFVLIALSPLLLIITVILFFVNSGTPFYVHERPGKDGQLFGLIKFKSMNDNRDETGTLLPDVHRVTGIGRLMRSFSIDELPQLLNVLKGDMSLIGPHCAADICLIAKRRA